MDSLFWFSGAALLFLGLCDNLSCDTKKQSNSPSIDHRQEQNKTEVKEKKPDCEPWPEQLAQILNPEPDRLDLTHRPLLTTHAPPVPLPKTQVIPVPQPGLELDPKGPQPNCDPNVRFNPAKPLIVNDVKPWSFIPTGDILAKDLLLESAPNLYNDQVLPTNVAAQNNPKRWQAWNDISWTPTRVDQYTEYLPYEAPCEVGKKDPKFWRGDLNAPIAQRNLVMGAQWNFYNHLKSKQLWMQYLAKDMDSRRDPYTRLVRRPHQQECRQTDPDENYPKPPHT